jgi:PPP family 3-phenylpropionic acid transporter
VWGWIADHRGGRIGIVRMATGVTLLIFLFIPHMPSFGWMMALMTLYGFFWNAAPPQIEVVTFNHLGDKDAHYGRIRLWGSVGFIVSVTTLGWLLQKHGLGLLPMWITSMLAGVFLVSLSIQEKPVQATLGHAQGLFRVLRRPEVLALLTACCLIQLSHGPYYSFFSIYLEANDYSRSQIGVLWSLGVFAEIFVFLAMPFLARRLGMRRLFLFAIAVTVMRWSLLANFVNNEAIIVCVQLMHLASFGLYHAVAVNLIHRFFRGKLQGRGQALYSSVSFGLGGGIGSLLSGYLWDISSPTTIYTMAAVVAVIAWLICWLALHVETRDKDAGYREVASGSSDLV